MLIKQMYYLRKVLSQQKLSNKKLEELRNKKLRGIIKYAYKSVPYYHKEWNKHKVKPDGIKTIADLKKLPLISKKIVLKNYNNFISTDYKKYVNVFYKTPSWLYMRSTSGTSGTPFKVYYNPDAKDYLDAIYARALLNVGYDPWKPMVYYWWQKPTKKYLYNKFGLFRKTFVQHSWDEDKQFEVIKEMKPEYIYYYPSALYFIARKILYGGFELGFKPKLIISHAEILTNGMRKTIEEAFGCKVFDEYGTNEFNRVGWECEERNGYHYDADSVNIEIADDSNEDVGEGKMGKVLITGFINKVIPLIRYDIGDYAVKADESQTTHDCGINLPVLIKSVEGRAEHTAKLENKMVTQKSIMNDVINFMEKRKEFYKFQAFGNMETKKIVVNYIPFEKDFLHENERMKFQGFEASFSKVTKINKNEVSGKTMIFELN